MALPRSILELPTEDIEAIEEAIGIPVDQWGRAPKGTLFPLVLGKLEGKDPKAYAAAPFGEIVDRVTLGAEPAPKTDSGPA